MIMNLENSLYMSEESFFMFLKAVEKGCFPSICGKALTNSQFKEITVCIGAIINKSNTNNCRDYIEHMETRLL